MPKMKQVVIVLVCFGLAGLAIIGRKHGWEVNNGVRPAKHFFIAELETPGGPLPFDMIIHGAGDSWSGAVPSAQVSLFDVTFKPTTRSGEDTVLEVRFPHFDSAIALRGKHSGTLKGTWTKNRGLNDDGTPRIAVIPIAAKRQESDYLFDRIEPAAPPADFTGRWSVKFPSSDDLAVGEFTVNEDQIATGTFLTTTGDYRYLYGQVDGDLMRLSTFDGAHAFLFHARMNDDGTIAGDFWSGDWWHETWTAARDPNAQLPDAFSQTSLNDDIDLRELTFTDLDGNAVRLTDALDQQGGKARIVELFGTWCPNCADAAKEIRRLKAKHEGDLGVVALAFELTDDHARSVQQIERYKQRHNLDGTTDWPILIAGVSDKAKATESVRLLDRVRSYPTTLFLNASNEVVAIHTGFTGPATGDAYRQQQQQWESIIDGLLAE